MFIRTAIIISCFLFIAIIAQSGRLEVGVKASGSDDKSDTVIAGAGTLDTSFGINGVVVTTVGLGNEVGQAVAMQPDGKIVVGGYANTAGNNDFAVFRYMPDGTLDNTFDGSTNANGAILTQIGPSDEEAYGIAIQNDGKIILAGQSYDGMRSTIAFVRYNPDGTLDNSFSGDGRQVVLPLVGGSIVRSVAVRPDGKIVAAGNASNGVNQDIVVVQLNANGELDETFDGVAGNGNGIVTVSIGSANDFGYGVAAQADGKIVVAGYFTNATSTDTVVFRLNADGRFDSTFSKDGISTISFSPEADEALALALAPDGKIVIAGCIRNGGPNDFLFARFADNGSLDQSFGTNGSTVVPFSGSSDLALGMAVQPNGKIVAVGFGSNGANNDFAVARVNTNGSLDTTFGDNGRALTMIGSSTDSANAVAVQADGRIVVVGRTTSNSSDLAILRYEPGFASISGRVFGPNGAPLRGTRVLLIDANSQTRSATTSTFGYYQFDNVLVSRTYTLAAVSRRYRFVPLEVVLSDNLADRNLTGLE